MVTHDGPATETHAALKMVSMPPVDLTETEGSGSLQGIITGVVVGGVIWLGVLLLVL